jgi:methionyl-tRNA formyltransferase
MKCLTRNSQSQTRLDLLIKSCKIKSDNIKGALSDHLVRGASKTIAAALNNIPAGNLTRALKRLEQQAQIIEKIKEHDWVNHK